MRPISAVIGCLAGVLVGQLICLAAGEPGMMGLMAVACGPTGAMLLGLLARKKCKKKRKGLLIMTHECEEKKNEIETTIRELRAAAASIYDTTARLANVLNLVGDTDAVAERA